MNRDVISISVVSVILSTMIIIILPGMATEYEGFDRFLVLSIIPFFIIGCIMIIMGIYIKNKQDALVSGDEQ